MFDNVSPEPTSGCWLWCGPWHPLNYGLCKVGGKLSYAHRVYYERAHGSIPQGAVLDHVCRNPSCVNPDHLEPVSQAENCRRGLVGDNNRKKTHCPSGHPYSSDNTLISTDGKRRCRACMRRRNTVEYQRGKRQQNCLSADTHGEG